MDTKTSDPTHFAKAVPQSDGTFVATWNLTPEAIAIPVVIQLNVNVLPIVFVPGIMGSNLRSKGKGSEPVWRLDATAGEPLGLARRWASASAGERQAILHPDRCEVDDRGNVPATASGSIKDRATYVARGWGGIAETSYHDYLLLLERELNGVHLHRAERLLKDVGHGNAQTLERWRAEKAAQPLTREDLTALSGWQFPVYAFAYNWLASNTAAAGELQQRITDVIAENNSKLTRCEQVVLVTHSMGGLVARRCQKLEGMEKSIAGIVHGVMPAVGAAVAYRRAKIGMSDEAFVSGLVLGSHGTDIALVFAQSPGALQLLPNKQYPKNWMRIADHKGRLLKALPQADPYAEIYRNHKDWWGLVKEEWLAPEGGIPIDWRTYLESGLKPAEQFHEELGTAYHPNTYVYYGEPASPDVRNSVANITWKSTRPPFQAIGMAEADVPAAGLEAVQQSGRNGLGVRDASARQSATPTQAGELESWLLIAELFDAGGDGTVPAISGRAPLTQSPACIRQQVRLTGIDHESAYTKENAQDFVFYALAKIAGTARRPTQKRQMK